ANCVVTDTNFTDAGCPASGTPSGASSAVAVSPSAIASLAAGATAPSVTGTIAGLTQNSCNTTAVTCEIVGSVDPANPSARKKLTATAQDTCETCSVQVDKQIKCGAGPFIDVGFVTNNEDGTASCLGWNAFTVNGTSTAAAALTVQYVAKNTGGTGRFGSAVTDRDAACPASGNPSGTSSAVAVSPSTIASLGHGSMTTATATVAGLTKDSCNTARVTCEIKGSVDPNNPGHQKTLTGTAKDTCETCSVKVDKQIKCGAGPFIDVGFVSNNEDGTASCLGWNAFTVNGTHTPAETLTVQYVIQNTGGTALFSCTATDSNTVISSTAVPIADMVVVGGTSTPVPINTTCSDTLDASEPVTGTVKDLTNDSCNTTMVTCDIKGSQDGQGNAKKLSAKAKDTCEVPICKLAVEKTACVAAVAPPGPGCTGGAIALTLKYTGPSISGPTTVTVTGASRASVTYSLASLNNGDILTQASENDFTIDATAHGQSKLGSKTTVTINGDSEVLHTSCSCRATPETNLALCNPACLDSSSPDNTTGFKGAPSPLWTLVGLKDPKLG